LLHVSVEALSHAFGQAFDNPNLAANANGIFFIDNGNATVWLD
jgi:hypothetical protein